MLDSDDLALRTGSVTVKGKAVGRFNPVWRLEALHAWHIAFD